MQKLTEATGRAHHILKQCFPQYQYYPTHFLAISDSQAAAEVFDGFVPSKATACLNVTKTGH